MTEGNVNQPANPGDAAKANRSVRRRLMKGALLATPLIVTLRGKPAHAQLSSLGSVDTPDGPIMYGPGAYVTQQDISQSKQNGNSNNGLDDSDLGKAIKKKANGKFEILKDKTRRKQTGTGKEFDRK